MKHIDGSTKSVINIGKLVIRNERFRRFMFFNEQRIQFVKKTFTKRKYNDEYCLIKI